jgi:peptide/nickel transport system substrate-binding protein/microcin C transport system substrate-binding protein
VFGPAYVAPRTNGDPKLLRQNLLKARDLLAAAGWKVAADGRLRNEQGEAFEVEYLTAGDRGNTCRMASQLRKARRHAEAAQRRLRACFGAASRSTTSTW